MRREKVKKVKEGERKKKEPLVGEEDEEGEMWDAFLNEGNPCLYREKGNSPKRPQPTFQQSLTTLLQVPAAQLPQPPKIQQCGCAQLSSRAARSKVGRATLAFQTWSRSPLHSASEISSNRSIERLGFMLISIFQFFILQNWFCLQHFSLSHLKFIVNIR